MYRSSETPLGTCRVAFSSAASLRALRNRLAAQGARAVLADGVGDPAGQVGQIASGRADVAVGLVADAAVTLIDDALRREVVVLITQQWAGCPLYLLARDASAAFDVAGALGAAVPDRVRGLSLADRVIADLTAGPGSESGPWARFRRKLVEAGAQLTTSPDQPGCIGAIFSPATPVRVLLASSPFGEVLVMCCHESREPPTGIAFVRLSSEAPSLAAMAQAFTAIAALPEAAERRWMA
jgi:hypothetical protein